MYQNYQDGWLEVISGCMFAGKTEELIRRAKPIITSMERICTLKTKGGKGISSNQK